jgi:outer membrane protein assembly factor BamE (lipoprotein component of BamABCDE complex)
MKKMFFILICACNTGLLPNLSHADEVHIPVGQQGQQQSTERPKAGLSKAQVKSLLGEPKNAQEAVGNPPISSWTYENFTVYFEYDRVIHSVLTN